MYWRPQRPAQWSPYPCDSSLGPLIISFIITVVLIVINVVLLFLNSQGEEWKWPAPAKGEEAIRESQKIPGEKKNGFSFLFFFFND